MQQVVFLLLIGLVLIQADSLLEMDAHCAEECGSPEYDELVKELDHQDEVLNDLVTRAVNVEHSLDQSKKEHDDADRESRNLLLRLDRLHSDKEHDVCPKKHRKCLTSAARDGKPCVANILVCDGEEDCLDGSDEDPELCKFPIPVRKIYGGQYFYFACTSTESTGFHEEIFIEKIESFDIFKPLLKAKLTFVWEYKQMILQSISTEVHYKFADKMATSEMLFEGSMLHLLFTFPDEAIDVRYYRSTGEECAHAAYTHEYHLEHDLKEIILQ